MKKCLYCNKDLFGKQRKYCNSQCQNDHRYHIWIKKWINGEIDGSVKGGCSSYIKRYLREKHNNKCSKCGWNEIHPILKTIPLDVNHIDGNHKNNAPSNIEILCPNCHSLTETYKNLNKGKGRTYRKK